MEALLRAAQRHLRGVNRTLDSATSFKELRVRVIDAVSVALLLKAAGWNIAPAAKIMRNRRRKAEMKASGRPSRHHWGSL